MSSSTLLLPDHNSSNSKSSNGSTNIVDDNDCIDDNSSSQMITPVTQCCRAIKHANVWQCPGAPALYAPPGLLQPHDAAHVPSQPVQFWGVQHARHDVQHSCLQWRLLSGCLWSAAALELTGTAPCFKHGHHAPPLPANGPGMLSHTSPHILIYASESQLLSARCLCHWQPLKEARGYSETVLQYVLSHSKYLALKSWHQLQIPRLLCTVA